MFYIGSPNILVTDKLQHDLHIFSNVTGTNRSIVTPNCIPAELSLTEQYCLLSTLNNYHWDKYLTHNGMVNENCDLRRGNYKAYQEGDVDNKSVPTSFRNRYIFYMYGRKFNFVEQLLLYEFDGVIPSRSNARTEHAPTSNKRLRTNHFTTDAHRNIKTIEELPIITPPELSNTIQNIASVASPYENFIKQITSKTIQWRKHNMTDSITDVCIMNAYDIRSGVFKHNKYEHISRHKDKLDESIKYTCTCKVYKTITNAINDEISCTSCFHVQYFRQHVEPNLMMIFSDKHDVGCGYLVDNLRDGLNALSSPVLYLSVTDNRTLKFSTVGTPNITNVDLFSIVTLTDSCFHCPNASCYNKHTMRNASVLLSDKEDTRLCCHLERMKSNNGEWRLAIQDVKQKYVKKKRVCIYIYVCVWCIECFVCYQYFHFKPIL